MPENGRPQAQDYQVGQELRGRYLTLALADQEDAISILKVREIIGRVSAPPGPAGPDHVCGVINLRDEVVPVVDLWSYRSLTGQWRTDRSAAGHDPIDG